MAIINNSEFLVHNAGDTYENLQNEIKIIFSNDKLGNRLCKALDKAIDVGQSLGVIQMTNDLVRIPFNYNRGTACPRAINMVVLLGNSILLLFNIRKFFFLCSHIE